MVFHMDRDTFNWLVRNPENVELWRIWGQTDEDRAAIREVFTGAPVLVADATKLERSKPSLPSNVVCLTAYRAQRAA